MVKRVIVMKVLQVVRQYKPAVGGLETFVSELATHLQEGGVETEVLTLNRNFADGTALASQSVEEGINVRRISYFGSKRYPIALSTIQYLKQFDLIHVHAVDSFVDYLSILKPFHRKPIILSTHGGFFHTKNQEKLKEYYFKTITKMVLKNVNKVIACSNNDANIFEKITKNNMELIENGINVEKYQQIKHRKCTKNHFITVGRFSKNKRIDLLLELISNLSDEFPDIKLRVVGRDYDGLKDHYHSLINRLGISEHVEIIEGASDDELLELMADSQYFVSASEYEGFGLSALEAMAAGRIPVLNRIPSFVKMINDEKNGYILEFQSMEKAVKKAKTILGSSNNDVLIEQAIAYSESYSWKTVVKGFQEVYEGVYTG